MMKVGLGLLFDFTLREEFINIQNISLSYDNPNLHYLNQSMRDRSVALCIGILNKSGL